MECKKEENKIECGCSYVSCGNRGVCCDCVRHHRENNEIPGCFFTAVGERTYDRSVKNFILTMKDKYGI